MVETFGSLRPAARTRGMPHLPSNSTKESYAKYLLSAKSLGIIFAVDESSARWRSAETRIAAAGDIG